MRFAFLVARSFGRAVGASLTARVGPFRRWPDEALLLDEPLALAEQRTARLRRIYANALRDAWDGPAIFREAVARHGGLQLPPEKRAALAYPISMLMWGELGAWIVSAELAERLEDPDARMAASSQVFDEARHFYVLRDYLAALHVPVPKLDPLFAIGVRSLLGTRDLCLKLFAMQILAEGTAQVIFRFLAEGRVEPVLSDVLPYVERDEARHVGLGVLHLPKLMGERSPKERRRLAARVGTIGDLFGATQVRYAEHYRALGLDPRDLIRRADRMLHELAGKMGRVPGTGEPYFRAADPSEPGYEERLAWIVPEPGVRPPAAARLIRAVIDLGARALPA
jgi:hypothetical protein